MRWVKDNHHLLLGIMWMVLAVPTLLWWKQSILWVALMSLYANIETCLGAHHAHKARQQAAD